MTTVANVQSKQWTTTLKAGFHFSRNSHLINNPSWLSEARIIKPWASFFQQKRSEGADTNSEVEGDNDCDEEFFKKRNQKVPM